MTRVELICGDAGIELVKLPAESIDCCITSPPYDNLRIYDGFKFDFEVIAQGIWRVMKQGGVVVWVVGDQTVNGGETGTSFKQALYFKDLGFNLHDTMIYDKGKVIFPNPNRYHQCFEYMFVFSKGCPKTINLLSDRKNKWAKSWGKRSFRQPDGSLKKKEISKMKDFGVRFNIWKIDNGYMHTTLDKFAFEHPAMFPEALARDHILSWTKKGDTVLDPMCGSGTTGKMAKELERNFLGIEISEKYCAIAKKRLHNEMGRLL